MRFLYVKKFKIQGTLDALKQRIEYRKGWPLEVNSKHFELLNNGLVYLQGRDRNYRPVVSFKCHIAAAALALDDSDAIVTSICLFWEYMLYHMMKDGKIENSVQIVDHSEVNVGAFGMEFVKKLLRTV